MGAKKNPVKSFAKEFEKEYRKFQKAIRKDGKQFVNEIKKLAKTKKLKESQRFADTIESSLRSVEETTTKLLAKIHAGANKFETLVNEGLGRSRSDARTMATTDQAKGKGKGKGKKPAKAKKSKRASRSGLSGAEGAGSPSLEASASRIESEPPA